MKYVNECIVFQEVPDEVTLAINISNCPCHCPGCHSKFLWGDIGTELTNDVLEDMINKYNGEITCVAFMGGDANVNDLMGSARYLKNIHPNLKVAWYSGRTVISTQLNKDYFDYLKLGPYIAHLGPLKSKTTNQRMYKKIENNWTDITSRFWR